MRSQVIALTQALKKAKGGTGEVREDEVVVVSDELSGKLATAEREIRRLKAELAFAEEAQQEAAEGELSAITERDALRAALEKSGASKSPSNAGDDEDDDTGVIRGYNATIQALRAEVKILRHRVTQNDDVENEDEDFDKIECISECIDDDEEDEEEEQNQNELNSVEKTLRLKEKRMLELAKKSDSNSSADELRKR
jgi:uncharacterized small protein (DUF1192 family)